MDLDRKSSLLLAICLLVLVTWLGLTPPGLLGKTDSIGYAVCHRIPSHSFHLGVRPLSLCARCTGQYLGFLIGLFFQLFFGQRRAKQFPGKEVQVLLIGLIFVYLLDGFNSYLSLDPRTGTWMIYQPDNSLRLAAGMGAGISLSAFMLPFFNRVTWIDGADGIIFPDPAAWLGLAGAAGLVIFLVLTGNPFFLYPLTLTAAVGVLLFLTLTYAVIWMILFQREKQFRDWRDLSWILALGLLTGMTQIALLDLVRYWSTGTWDGFHLG